MGPAGPPGDPGPQGPPGQDFQPPAGTPIVESATDATGGPLVVGDVLVMQGSSLDAVDVVLVGDAVAPIVEQTADTLRVQIPEGVSAGTHPVQLVNFSSDAGLSDTPIAVNVHRLAVMLGGENDKIVVVDTTDHSLVASLDATIADAPSELSMPPYRIGFANEGSLAIVPTGDGQVVWIDLPTISADPAAAGAMGTLALHDPNVPNDPTQMTSLAVAVSPDQTLAVVADDLREQLWRVAIDEAAPPYASPLSVAGGPLVLPANTGPRDVLFTAQDALVVAEATAGDLRVISRDGATLTDTGQTVATDATPVTIAFEPADAMLLTGSTLASWTLRAYTVGGTQVADLFGASVAFAAPILTFAMHPAGTFAYVVPLNGDLLLVVRTTPTALAELSGAVDAASGSQMRSVAVDPVDGAFAYVGLRDGDFLDIFTIDGGGGTLRRAASNPLAGLTDLANCLGIGIQP